MLISDDQYQQIAARWQAAFDSPLEGRSEFWDYGMRVALAAFKDGEKVWEQRDNLGRDLLPEKAVESLAAQVRAALPLQHPH